jgi:hypothetical protein
LIGLTGCRIGWQYFSHLLNNIPLQRKIVTCMYPDSTLPVNRTRSMLALLGWLALNA